MNDLKAYFTSDYQIGQIKIHNPTLQEIAEYGEDKFWDAVMAIIATRYDCRLYLWNYGIDFNNIHDWQVICQRVKDHVFPDCTLILPNVRFDRIGVYVDNTTKELVLFDPVTQLKILESDFTELQDYLRKMLNLAKHDIRDGNEHTRKWRLQHDLDKLKRQQARGDFEKFKSVLTPYVSALINCAGFKYDWQTVRDLPIHVFMDSAQRLQMIQQSQNLLQGIYSGNVSYKDLKHKEELNWLREIKPK